MERSRALSALVALTLASGLAGASSVPQERETKPDRLGWHTVRPGETLELITQLYLGTTRLWEENWKLNPELTDPDRLRVGQRLRVILERTLPPRYAELTLLSNRVEQKPQPEPWTTAAVGSLLKERDGVRTYERSSAQLRFDDDSELVVTEDSIVFLTELSASVGGDRRDVVEIVEGEAELEARVASRRPSEIEIVVGDARTRPSSGTASLAKTRARRPASGGAAVMVFGGTAEVSSAGASVAVPTGMGTAVPEGGAPSPPEPLLPAPAPLVPAAGARNAFANPSFEWGAVPGAVRYVVDVCSDPECKELVQRLESGTETRVRPEELPVRSLHWRVSAVSASGLDGFPSDVRALDVTSARRDVSGPVVAARVLGSGFVSDDGSIELGEGGALELVAYDDAAGVASVEYRWDDGEWRTYDGTYVRLEDGATSRRLTVRGADGIGREGMPWSVRVSLSSGGPPPPVVEVEERSSAREP